MTRHIFKLVWNRKRSTGLILFEILICFLVLCGLLSAALNIEQRLRRPSGFEFDNVWSVDIGGMAWGSEGDELAADRQTQADLIRTVKNLPEVEAVASSTNTPFSGSTWMDGTHINGQSVGFLWTMASPDLPKVLSLKLLHGRWPEDTDGALGYQPVVINRQFARDAFGSEDPVGKNMPVFDDEGQPTTPEEDARINRGVGVMEDYRRRGIIDETPYLMLLAVDYNGGDDLPQELLVRVRPGTTAEFEEKLVRALQYTAPQWSYHTTLLDDRRQSQLMSQIGPLIMASVVAAFLIIMVGLGLVGVLWLTVTRRTGELGLRRALGATGHSVQRQILGELWALTGIAVVVGTIIFLQFPLFGANFGASWSVFLSGLALACLVIFGFVTICGLYPTWLATRVQPAAALQYE